MLGLLSIVLGVALAAMAGVSIWLHRQRDALRAAVDQLQSIVSSGRYSQRLEADGPAAELAASSNRLLEQVAVRDLLIRDRERAMTGLLGGLQEALAVHRERIVFANERFAAMVGAVSAADVESRALADLVLPEYREIIESYLRRTLAGEPALERLELELQSIDHRLVRVELTAVRIDYQGGPALLLTMVEMTPRSAGPAAPPRPRPTPWDTLDSLGEGVITTDVSGRIDYMNSIAEQLTGTSVTDALGKTLPEIISLVDETDRRSLGDPVRQCLSTQARVTVGRRGLMICGAGRDERSVELTASPLKGQHGELVGATILMRDVSELRGLARQMSYHASHDALTGLVNRREFERRLQESLEIAQTIGTRHVLCFLDLDGFKVVNDSAGHMAGDGMLREVASLIKSAVRDSDTVARLGGDEFGLLLTGCPLEKARQIADEVVRKIANHRFVWKDRIFTIGMSIGLVEVSRESGALDEVMSAADSACYVAKKHGNHVHVYSARDEVAARQRGEIQWLQRLQLALKENRFELLLQPIVAVGETMHGPAQEVFLRLQDESAPGGISPTEFQHAAERYRLMPDVDRWVVQTALTALARGAISLPIGRSIAINLSGQTLGDPQFLEFVVECLDRTGVSPQQLCFEVTENAVINNMEHAQRFIGVLHGMGSQFALDDFGRGLSSFGNLKHLPLDYLKIDGSFIRHLGEDSVNQAMVGAMIKLARTLNFGVVAEQVEDLGALEAAKSMGVDFVQGIQLGRPQPLGRSG